MRCNSCGNIIVGKGLICTNCGDSVKHQQRVSRYLDANKTPADKAEEVVLAEHKKSGLKNVNYRFGEHSDTKIPKDYVTIREREKRITEERISKEIEKVKQERLDAEAKESKINSNRSDYISGRIIGEKEFVGTPEQVAKKKKISNTKKMLITFSTFVTGLCIFIVCMSYLFWRFAPPGDAYKHNFMEWMSTNANGRVNEFLFDDMSLKDYYSPEKHIDFSGLYVSRNKSNINNVFLTYKEGELLGNYTHDGKVFLLKGYTSDKGEFLLLETIDGKPTATITGTIFSIGYLTGERLEQLTGQKQILSLEKVTTKK